MGREHRLAPDAFQQWTASLLGSLWLSAVPLEYVEWNLLHVEDATV